MTSWEKGIRPAGNLHPFHIVHNKNILAIIGRHTSSVFRRLIVMEAKYSKIFTKKLHSIPVSNSCVAAPHEVLSALVGAAKSEKYVIISALAEVSFFLPLSLFFEDAENISAGVTTPCG